ncbi:ribosome-dependent mRNA decay endonuclease Rae1/YacP [soil metagenome]
MGQEIERQRFLLVDGHSMVFGHPDLGAMHRRSPAAARVELERRLTSYQDVTGTRVVVVFDGAGPRTTEEPRSPGGIQVFYAAAGETADTVIERLARRYAGDYPMVVATEDRAEQDAVVAAGAQWIGLSGLMALLERAGRESAGRLRELARRGMRPPTQ